MIRDPDLLNALLDSVSRFVRERLVPAENEVAETDRRRPRQQGADGHRRHDGQKGEAEQAS